MRDLICHRMPSRIYYRNLDESPQKFCTRPKRILISIFLLLNCIFLIRLFDVMLNTHIILLEQNQTLLHVLPDKFLSFGLDSSLLRNMKTLPINNDKFVNLTRYLSPAYVRIGGTDADCLYFNKSASDIKTIKIQNLIDIPIDEVIVEKADVSNFTITSDDFLSLYKYCKNSEIKMIFDLNTLLRNVDGSWNSDNAKEIILFAKGHDMELDWQMGNEPNSFDHTFNIQVPAEQLAKDYCKLRSLLNELGYQESLLVGPEANHIGDEKHRGEVYVKNFLDNVQDCVDDVTWHQYYLNGHIAEVQDFLNSTVFDHLSTQIETMKEAIKLSGQKISMWLSETGSAYGSGAPEISDRFVAGFLWLDKLGYSAKAGVKTVIRQSLYGGHYAMIGYDLEPNPDWWIAVIFKQFVSNKVLNLSFPNNFNNIRLYAHCTSQQALANKDSVVTIYGMNLNKQQEKIYIQSWQNGLKIFSYFLTSNNLQSRNIFMNGELLKLQNNGSLPFFKPKIMKVNEAILLPPYSMFFLLIHNIEISACLTDDKMTNL